MLNNTEEKYIDLKTLGTLLHIKDNRTVIKWCENKNIEIQTINNKRLVFKFLVDMELDKKFIKQLQEKYPKKWEKLYRCYLDNDRIGYLFLVDETPDIQTPSIIARRITPQSSLSKELLD